MKHLLYIFIASLSLAILLPACQSSRSGKAQAGKTAPTATVSIGTLDIYPDFASEIVPPRTVSVWKPSGYHSGDSCSVIYMHDGQMLFDEKVTWNHREWTVDEVLADLLEKEQIPPVIVVGIDNSPDRLNEYFPDKAGLYVPGFDMSTDTTEHCGDAYLRFLVTEVKPFIDRQYSPLNDPEHTFVLGSSMGGLISLYALCEYPEDFGGAVCMSSHLSMGHLQLEGRNEQWAEGFRHYLADRLPPANSRRIYMDRGTIGIDEPYAPYQRQVDSLFAALGWDESHYQSLIFEGDEHNETCWGARLATPIRFVLGK